MRMPLLWISLLWVVLVAGPCSVFAAEPFCYYIDPSTVPLATLLGNPPADDSPAMKAEIETLIKLQANRTPDDLSRIAEEVTVTTAVFRGVLGEWFAPQNVPHTELLLDRAQHDVRVIAAPGKELWHRLCPPLQDTRVEPGIELPTRFSYPSDHAALGACWSLILAQLIPGQSKAILQRGAEIGYDRALAGVNFPSDVAAGEKLGNYLACRFLENPAFRAELHQAQAELQPWLQTTGAQ